MKNLITLSNSGLRIAFLLLSAIFLVIGTTRAATITVTNTNDSGAGSLRAAVANAASGDVIDLNLLSLGCPCTITLTSGQILIDKGLTIVGPGADALTISGNNTGRLFYITSGFIVTIHGLTLTGGNAPDAGGAISNLGVLYLNDSVVSGNTAAISTLSQGGGIYNGGFLFVTGSTISGNTAVYGGGIYNDYLTYATNSTISGNTAYYGDGGGIYFSGSTYLALLYNCTLSGNTGLNFGAGIYRVNTAYPGLITLRNTIVAGNSGGLVYSDVFGHFDSEGFNLIGVADGGTGFIQPTDQKGTAAAPLDPLLGPLQNNGGAKPTQALLPGSPAIDKGGVGWNPVTFQPLNQDQRGKIRPADDPAITNVINGGTGSDIGAFELEYDSGDATPPVVTPHISGTLGNDFWYTSDVQVSWSIVDNESTITIQNGCDPVTFSDDTSVTTLYCMAASAGGMGFQGVRFRRDATAPTLAPTVSPNPVLLNAAAIAVPNASDNLSGVASASCGAVDTSTVGSHSVACTATDNAGNTATVYAEYQVSNVFNFVGFFQPVDNLPTLNLATAGSSIPVKFSLGGDQGLAIFAAGYPASSAIQCDASEPGAVIEETVIAGGSTLSYNATTDQYNYVWKTDKTWKGTCRVLVVKFTDGSQHFAKFRFR
jgi:parallel beta-helix repeat protein